MIIITLPIVWREMPDGSLAWTAPREPLYRHFMALDRDHDE